MCGGTHGSPWDSIGMSYVGQSCVGWWILLANLDMSGNVGVAPGFSTLVLFIIMAGLNVSGLQSKFLITTT